IDLLFRTAAQVFGEGLIAVVLSGLGSDGASGARHVKEAGGTVVIQDPRTASYPSMPQALAPTTVDVIADVDSMGPLLRDLLTGAYTVTGPRDNQQLRAFLADLRERSGIDFGQYKTATIQRRLQRRMIATGRHSLADYRAYLEQNPEEYDRLVNAFLIKVTEFFRDADLFTTLREEVLPELIERGRTHGNTLRLWSAGCATGEEAYSLAILVAEALRDELDSWIVRIFATDLDKQAVDFARRGVYPASALTAVPDELRDRYLVAAEGTYIVAKQVRSLLVFGEHDLGQRPPFPHIDLCLCRNVLIYFTPELQRRALEAFAFALRDGGYLALGKAETTSPLPGYYTPVDQGLRLYRRHGDRVVLPVPSDRTAVSRIRTARDPASTQATQELARVRGEAQEARQAQLATEELLLRLPVGVAVVDRHYDLQRLNNAARRLLGIHTAALGEDLVHLARGIPAQELRAAIDAAMRGDTRTLEDIPTEAMVPGETRYLQIICRPDRMEGAAELVVLLIADVTPAALERTEVARLRALIEQLGATNRELLSANEELTTADALLRRSNEEYVLGNEEIQAATEEVETLNEELQATNEELETLNEEQQATVEELETTNDELRARSQETQELAAAVNEQRRRLEAILDSMGDALVALDAEGRPIFTNVPFEQLVGTTGGAFVAEDAEGRPLAPDATPQARLRGGEPFQMELTLMGADGQRRWYEATGRPLHANAPGHDGVLVLRDITDRTLRRLQDEFLALASHELRTPLTSIRGYIDLIDRGLARGQDIARMRAHAGEARAQIVRLNGLVNDLLDVSRLNGGALHLHRAPVDLQRVVTRVVETGRVIAPERTVRLDAPQDPVVIDGDSDRLEQVALNLLNNALTYAPESPVDVRLRRQQGTIELEVQDYGPGIAAEALPHLFTRFYQVASPIRDGRGGMGLGLFIAREIVEAHGGAMAVRSVVGEGTTFTVRLPLAPEEAREERASPT
ncbi:MAG TPA: CheR family methyltransferase, partial [Chloroflexota bacterium]|nr:CheR family methyltransferase [Chloroflexota bacterium]